MSNLPIPIAIIGIGCRLPGEITSTEKLWNFLLEGRSAWSPVPPDRYNEHAFYHPNPDHKGTTNHRGGHFLGQDIASFDAAFFGISPVEAQAIDPQQRLLLETTYEAFEDAGIPSEWARGSDTAVYTAMFTRDYDRNIYKDPNDIPKYHVTGSGEAIMSNRISYTFDFKGPSVTLDTGCSGSIVAMHQACKSLQLGESSMAVASGVSLILNPDHMFGMSNLHMLNDDGKSYAFDARGSGYGRGEGVVTVLLKRLDDAISAGDRVRAIVRNSVANQDGKTSGITLPSTKAQEALHRSAYRSIAIDPRDISYIEAHGTGTVAGDLAEMQAIANVFCNDRKEHLYVGSIKSNIGHLESASGLASIVKAILVLEHGLIPPNYGFQRPKTGMELEKWKIKIPLAVEVIPDSKLRRIYVSVNSFGYGGTNGNIILEKAQSVEKSQPSIVNTDVSEKTSSAVIGVNNSMSPRLFVFSARSKKSTSATMHNIRKWISLRPLSPSFLQDLAFTLSCRRSMMPWRIGIVATNLQGLLSTMQDENMHRRIRGATSSVKIAFIFTGQGAQWFAMGRGLLAIASPFRETLYRANAILKTLGASWDLISELSKNEIESRINEGSIAQPATTALQIALVDLLSHMGVHADTVIGHSSGEIAAAYAAGAVSQEVALRIAYCRSFISSYCKKLVSVSGAMLAVGLGEEDARKYIKNIKKGTISIACVNSPVNTTISGDEAAILEVKETLDARSIFNRTLNVDTAYHSHHMQKVSQEYLVTLQGLQTKASLENVCFISTVTATGKSVNFDASYWVENLVSKVRFADALKEYRRIQKSETKSTQTNHIFIEIGPHNALAGPTRQTIQDDEDALDYAYLPTLIRHQDAMMSILESVGKIFENGVPINFDVVNSMSQTDKSPKVIYDLPRYSWDHSNRYWFESRLSKEYRLRPDPYHDLLGVRIPGSTSVEPRWRHLISSASLPWLDEHVVDRHIVFPGSGYICMAIEAARQIVKERQLPAPKLSFILRNVAFLKALSIPPSPEKIELQLSFGPQSISSHKKALLERDFRITGLSQNGPWQEYCHGQIRVELISLQVSDKHSSEESFDRLQTSNHFLDISSERFYKDIGTSGNIYGHNFAAVARLKVGDGQAVAEVTIPDVNSVMPSRFMQSHIIHPTTLDALTHSALALYNQQYGPGPIMPVLIQKIEIFSDIGNEPGEQLHVDTIFAPDGPRSGKAGIMVFNSHQRSVNSTLDPVAAMSGIELRGLGETQADVSDLSDMREFGYRIAWDCDVNFIVPSMIEEPGSVSKGFLTMEEGKVRTLNRAAAVYIHRCLQILEAIDSKLIQPQYSDFVGWMKRYHHFYEERLANGTTIPGTEQVLIEARGLGLEGSILSRIGPQLVSVLTETAYPLLSTVNDNFLSKYLTTEGPRALYIRLARYVKHLCFKDPNMNILEIGAATGDTTLPILEALNLNNQTCVNTYDFTDISDESFDRVRQVLRKWKSIIRFKTLDIDRDPSEQGFTHHSYELVVAANVLYATSNLQQALINIHRLLKPGGRLVLIEVTHPQAYLNLAFGTLPRWWKGVNDGYKGGPLYLKQWQQQLMQSSFSGAEFVVNDIDGPAQIFSMIVSRAVEPKELEPSHPMTVIINEDIGGVIDEFVCDLHKELKHQGFQPSFNLLGVSQESIDPQCVYVVIDSGLQPFLVDPTPKSFQNIVSLLREGSNIVWISVGEGARHASRNPEKALITGLARSAHSENEHLNLVTMDIQDSLDDYDSNLVKTIAKVVSQSLKLPEGTSTPREREYVYSNGTLLIPRLMPDIAFNRWIGRKLGKLDISMIDYGHSQRTVKLYTDKPFLDNTVLFVEDKSTNTDLDPSEVEIKVKAHGVGSSDALVIPGHKSPRLMMGEFAGYVTHVGSRSLGFRLGDRVCGWGGSPYASHVRVKSRNAFQLPDSVSFTVGAALPIACMTVYHALCSLADLQGGETILVLGATELVGHAALSIARHIGATTFAISPKSAKCSESSKEGNLPSPHIFLREGSLFKQRAFKSTNGKGFDVVLDISSSEAHEDVWTCVKSHGTIIQIKGLGVSSKAEIIGSIGESTTFISFDPVTLFLEQPHKASTLLGKVMPMLSDCLPDLLHSITTLPISKIREAFQLIRSNRQSGKVVLTIDDDARVNAVNTDRPVAKLETNATYVVAGGLGDFGQRLCHLMVERGAKYIVALSRRKPDSQELLEIERSLQSIASDCRFYLQICDIAKISQVENVFSNICKMGIPPIRGVVQSAAILYDCTLGKMSLDDYQAPLQAKVYGTRHLNKVFQEAPLDFFLMLSSSVGVIGTGGQANYAAGNTYQDAFAINHRGSKTHYMALDIGFVQGANINNQVIENSLQRQGLAPIKPAELLAVFEYAMSADSKNCEQAIIGFNAESLSRATGANVTSKTAMYSHIWPLKASLGTDKSQKVSTTLQTTIRDLDGPKEILRIIKDGIAQKISSLIAINGREVSMDLPLVDLGFDSLVAIEVKNWIAREYGVTIQASDILDQSSIIALAQKIASTSALASRHPTDTLNHNADHESDLNRNSKLLPRSAVEAGQSVVKLPVQPLPLLEDTLQTYLDTARTFCSDEEFGRACKTVAEFKAPGGLGQQLHARLLERNRDLHADNWLADIYVVRRFLRLRTSLVACQSYYGTHPFGKVPHKQAKRAALVSIGALKFKHALDSGKLEPHYFAGQAVDTDSFQWLFNACRKPRIGEDQLQKHAEDEYIVAFRHGHAFKVTLKDPFDSSNFGFLEAAYEKVLAEAPEDWSWIGILTADKRDRWAENRKFLQAFNGDNELSMHAIEAATFIICLDDARPETSSERFYQFLYSDGRNRFYDKTLQFVVCSNGTSGTICEHSALDALSAVPLQEFINSAILDYESQTYSNGYREDRGLPRRYLVEEIPVKTNAAMDMIIAEIRQSLDSAVTHYSFAYTEIKDFGKSFFLSHKCPVQSGIQLAIQLACRRFFGYNPPAVETVSMAHFRKGRVEVSHIIQPAVATFLAAAGDKVSAGTVVDLRAKFFEGAKAHAKALTLASKGRGFGRHMTAMEWMLQEGEETPALFQDPVYARMKPGKVVTSGLTTGWLEGGFIYPVPGSIFVCFDVKDTSVGFSIFGHDTDTTLYAQLLETGSQEIRSLLA